MVSINRCTAGVLGCAGSCVCVFVGGPVVILSQARGLVALSSGGTHTYVDPGPVNTTSWMDHLACGGRQREGEALSFLTAAEFVALVAVSPIHWRAAGREVQRTGGFQAVIGGELFHFIPQEIDDRHFQADVRR